MSTKKEKGVAGEGLVHRVRRALASSPWAKSAARGTAYVLGVALLALVGSGRMARWLSPPPRLAIGVADAAAAPPPAAPTASVSAAEAPSAPRPELAVDQGDAGAPPEVGDGGAPSAGIAPDGKVILNLASEEDLRRLPGVGHGRAQAILALRVRLKKFTRVEDLLKVKGIGRRGLSRLRPLVRVD
jgi:competence protein ComEA